MASDAERICFWNISGEAVVLAIPANQEADRNERIEQVSRLLRSQLPEPRRLSRRYAHSRHLSKLGARADHKTIQLVSYSGWVHGPHTGR